MSGIWIIYFQSLSDACSMADFDYNHTEQRSPPILKARDKTRFIYSFVCLL